MKRIVLAAILASIIFPAKADDTTRPALRRKPSAQRQEVRHQVYDTIPSLGGELSISGYDKPLNARRASFHVTSTMPDTVTGFEVTLDYRDLSGRQLHVETVTVDCLIPPYGTRLVTIPSWDTQGRYFYTGGKQPRSRGVTPYDVKAIINSIILPHRE